MILESIFLINILKIRVIGITKLDAIRSITFLSEEVHVHPNSVVVPVVGGHAGETIVPLFSKAHDPVLYGTKTSKVFFYKIV